MSVELWPPIAPEHLQAAVDQTQRRELEWLLNELRETLEALKAGLEECYALLAPVDPGSTLVVSTPRAEIVKGHVTRVGTHIVKGTLALRLRTHPHQSYTIAADAPIPLAPLTALHALLHHSIELLALTLAHTAPAAAPAHAHDPQRPPLSPPPSPTLSTAAFLAAQLRLLAQTLADAAAQLRGPPPRRGGGGADDAAWVSRSCAPAHFAPPPPRDLSVCWGVQDSCLVLWLRGLEPADAPVSVGMKVALALGTARRLEHDEAERVFAYTYPVGSAPPPTRPGTAPAAGGGGGGGGGFLRAGKHASRGRQGGRSSGKEAEERREEVPVFVREKVRIESADPSLLSLSAKLAALTNTLALARGNLAAVMGQDLDEWTCMSRDDV